MGNFPVDDNIFPYISSQNSAHLAIIIFEMQLTDPNHTCSTMKTRVQRKTFLSVGLTSARVLDGLTKMLGNLFILFENPNGIKPNGICLKNCLERRLRLIRHKHSF